MIFIFVYIFMHLNLGFDDDRDQDVLGHFLTPLFSTQKKIECDITKFIPFWKKLGIISWTHIFYGDLRSFAVHCIKTYMALNTLTHPKLNKK